MERAEIEKQMISRKRNWIVQVPGYKEFPMVVMDGPLTQAEALIEARKIWPNCSVS